MALSSARTYRLPKASPSILRLSPGERWPNNLTIIEPITTALLDIPGMERRLWIFVFDKAVALLRFFNFKPSLEIPDDIECNLSTSAHPPQSNGRLQSHPSYAKSGSTSGDCAGDDTHSTSLSPKVPFNQEVNQPQFSEGPARFLTAADGLNDCLALSVTDTLIPRLRDLYEDSHHLSGKRGPLDYARREAQSLESVISQSRDAIKMATNQEEVEVLQETLQRRETKLLKVRQRKDTLETDVKELERNIASYRAHIEWVLENAMKEANLLEPHRPLTPVTVSSVESEPGTEEVSHHYANNGKHSTVENLSDEADYPVKHSNLLAAASNAPEERQTEALESYNEVLVTMHKVQALFDDRQQSYETDLADYQEGFANGIYTISRSDFDRSKLRYGQKLTRALINAEEAVEAAKQHAQAIGALESDYHDANDYYGYYYEESCSEEEIASYLAAKDWSHVHEWLAEISEPVELEEYEVKRSTVDDQSTADEVDPADSISQVDFDDYRRDIDRWEDLRYERWEAMRAQVGGPELQVGFLVRNVESLERRHSVPMCRRFE